MRVVAALGGNALLHRGEPPDSDIQEAHIIKAVEALAPLAMEHDLILTHGNGPQVGLLALESEHDPDLSRPYPFDVLVARTLVHSDDPAFSAPSKFVGAVYDEQQAHELAAANGWTVRPDGDRWRR